ncbi:MAG: replication protein [Oscillospiraceae bacterium]|jgi:DNA replication protein DnaC|nr:replication protein [Oscillospiraceae bacterium]
MSYDKAVFEKAEREISSRRISAETSAQIRLEEIEQKIPEISEINRELANTSIELSSLILERKGDFEKNFEELKLRNLQGQEMIKNLLKTNGYPEDYLEVKYFCPKCQDKGYINGQRCECFKKLLWKYATEQLNANSQMMLCSFETFNLDYYSKIPDGSGLSDYEKMKNVYNHCKNYAKNFSLKSPSIFMLGLTGLGKTHLSFAIAKEVIEKGYNVAYDSAVNYLRAIEKEHFGRSDNDKDTLQILLNTDLLILDDLGAEYESGFYVSTIYNIINTRLNKGLPTIINSNLTPAELQKRYDDRIVSRLLAMYDYLRFFGNDIRQIKKMNGEM